MGVFAPSPLSDAHLFCDCERVVDLDAKVTHGAFNLRVAKQKLDLTEKMEELFFADKFEPTVKAIRADVAVTIIPGLNPIGIITDPRAVPAIAAAVRGKEGQE